MRSAVVVLSLGVLLAGCGGDTDAESTTRSSEGATPTSTTSPPPPDVPTCSESGLQVSAGDVDAAMGLRVMGLTLENCGTETHTLTGYPVITLLDEDRQPFDVQVHHGSEPITPNQGFCTPTGQFDAGPQVVSVAPGEQASAAVVWRNLTTDELDRLVNAPYLSVAPTEGEAAHEVALSGPIDLGTTERLGVSAWRPPGGGCS